MVILPIECRITLDSAPTVAMSIDETNITVYFKVLKVAVLNSITPFIEDGFVNPKILLSFSGSKIEDGVGKTKRSYQI